MVARFPLPRVTSSAVLMFGVLQLVPPAELDGVFRELKRVTKPGGQLLFGSIPDAQKKRAFLDPYLAGVRQATHLTDDQKQQIITRNQNAYWYDYEDLAQKWQALGGQPSQCALSAFDPDVDQRFHMQVIIPG